MNIYSMVFFLDFVLFEKEVSITNISPPSICLLPRFFLPTPFSFISEGCERGGGTGEGS